MQLSPDLTTSWWVLPDLVSLEGAGGTATAGGWKERSLEGPHQLGGNRGALRSRVPRPEPWETLVF